MYMYKGGIYVALAQSGKVPSVSDLLLPSAVYINYSSSALLPGGRMGGSICGTVH
jgi:hypothetical protein